MINNTPNAVICYNHILRFTYIYLSANLAFRYDDLYFVAFLKSFFVALLLQPIKWMLFETPTIITLGISLIDLKHEPLTLVLTTPHTIHKSRCSYNQIRTLSHQMITTLLENIHTKMFFRTISYAIKSTHNLFKFFTYFIELL